MSGCRVAHRPPEQGRYYIVMPADATATREPPRVVEEICTEGCEPGLHVDASLRLLQQLWHTSHAATIFWSCQNVSCS